MAWFHKLLRYSINSFNELWASFISQYLYSVRQKRSIISLQTILKQEEESIRDFTKGFGQAVQQIESYSMDPVFQNFRRSFGPSTPFFQSLFLDPPTMMEELYRWADMYTVLEDNIRTATQIVMFISPLAERNQPLGKQPSRSKEGKNRDLKQSSDQSQKKREPLQFTPQNVCYERLLPIIHDLPSLNGLP